MTSPAVLRFMGPGEGETSHIMVETDLIPCLHGMAGPALRFGIIFFINIG